MRDPEALGEAILTCLDHPGTRASDAALEPYTEQAAVELYLRAVGSSGPLGSPDSSIHLRPVETPQNYVDYESA